MTRETRYLENHHDTMHACCIDIDARCAHMTYLQLSLLHIPAIVLHANSLSGEVWSRWYTPAHALGGWRQRLAARRERQPVAVPSDPAPTAADPASSTHGPSAVSPRLSEQLRLFED